MSIQSICIKYFLLKTKYQKSKINNLFVRAIEVPLPNEKCKKMTSN